MNALVIGVARTARRGAPACAVVAAIVLSLGAYSGDARVIGRVAAGRSFTLTLTPRKVTLSPGGSARIVVVIHRRHRPGQIRLGLASKLPRGLTVRFMPPSTGGKRSVLTLRATTRLLPGRYVLKVGGTHGRSKRTTKLVITVVRAGSGPTGPGATSPPNALGNGAGTGDVGASFSISGSPDQPLRPGISDAINLQVANPNSTSLTLNSLTVAVSAVDAPGATPSLPCTTDDFSIQQYSGLLPLVIAPDTTVNLEQLAVPPSEWPEVSMLDRTSNQDGCQGASIRLAYSAAASLG